MLIAEAVNVKTGNANREVPMPTAEGMQLVPISFAALALDFHLMSGAGEFTVAMPREVAESLHKLIGEALKKGPGLIIPEGVNGNELRQ